MEKQANNSALKKFVIKVAVVDTGLIVTSAFISTSQHLNFGITLLIVGILLGGIGNLLAGPSLVNRQTARDLSIHNRPNEALADRISTYVANSIPHYGFENVIMYSGLITIVISIPFLIILMF